MSTVCYLHVQVLPVPPCWLFVRIETSDGYVGWGESNLEGHTEAVEGAFQELSERFLGWDADGIEDIWQNAYRTGFSRGGSALMARLHLHFIPKTK
jgi:galactonate dehydratase